MGGLKMRKISLLVIAVSLLIFVVACSSGNTDSTKEETGNDTTKDEAELIEVNMGLMPYFDYAPWAVAEEKGFFEEEGLTLNSTMFPVEGNVAPALINGSIDIGAFSDTPSITLASQFDDLRMVSFHNVFKGFAIMSRDEEEIKTYEELLNELGDSQEAANVIGEQLKGKSVVTTSGATFYMVLQQALENAGLSLDDIEIIDIEPDAGVSAFISGTGDFYLGGLPQREKLEEEGFIPLISGEEIGPGAVILAGLASTKEYLDSNPEIIEKVENVWFKAMEYIVDNPEDAYGIMASWSNEQDGGSSTADDVKGFFEDYVVLAKTLEETEQMFYDSSSEYYWNNRYQFLVDYHEDTEEIKEGSVNIDELVVAEEIFNDLKK